MMNNVDIINESTKLFGKHRKNIVGLLNQGGTCYLNSLLQTLFHTPEFTYRLFNLAAELQLKTNIRNVNKIESGNNEEDFSPKAKFKIIRELLRLFYNLMTINKFAISSKSLTNSFGWSDEQLYVHQDVQELNRLLFEEMENSLKGTGEADLINDIYKGIIVTKIRCLRCGNCSAREDEYLDVNLAVLEHDSVEKALVGLTAIEKLNGDNQYYCEKCQRKVDANKFAFFKEFPTILTLCLARFDFDPRTMQSIKVDKYCTFPLVLDVAEFMERKTHRKLLYDLFSIVIHVGNSTLGGHYHAYIKDPYGFEMTVEANENNMDDDKQAPTYEDKQEFYQTVADTSNSQTSLDYDQNPVSTGRVPMDADENNVYVQDDYRDFSGGDHRNSDLENGQSMSVPAIPPKQVAQRQLTTTVSSHGSNTTSENITTGCNNKPIPMLEIPTIEHHSIKPQEHFQLIDTNNNEPMEYGRDDSENDLLAELSDEIPEDERDCPSPNDNFSNFMESLNNINTSQQTDGRLDSKSSNSKPTPTNSWSSMNKLKFKTNGNDFERRRSSNSDSNNEQQESQKSDKKANTKFIEKGRWFDFNDETITEIKPSDFPRVFSGQECAYILFYRSRSGTTTKL